MNMYTFESNHPNIYITVYDEDDNQFEVEVTRFHVQPGSYSYSAASDVEYYGFEELEFTGADHLSESEYETLHDELMVYLKECGRDML